MKRAPRTLRANRFLALLVLTAGGVAASPAARATPPIELELVATLVNPLYVTHAGDDRLFIAQRNGRILVHTPEEGVLATPFLDLTSLVDQTGNGGLFTMAFHPDYGASNDFFFVSYTETGTGGAALESVIARYEVSGDPNVADPGSRAELIRYPEPNYGHNTGQVAFGPDGYLYISSGDGGVQLDPDCLAQQDDGFHGKLLRIDVDQNAATSPFYGIPSGNPYADPGDGVLDEIWARGLRNPWRFSFDPLNGDLWIGDPGQSAKEEIDFQPASSPGGENYAWSIMEGSTCFDPDPIKATCPSGTPSCFDASYTDPVFEYDNAGSDCAIIGGFVYRGDAIDGIQGRYIFGDVCSKLIWSLEGAPGSFTRNQIADGSFVPTGFLTSFGHDVDGELYVTIHNDVYRLVQDEVPPTPAVPTPSLGPPGLALLVAALLGTATLFARRTRRAGGARADASLRGR